MYLSGCFPVKPCLDSFCCIEDHVLSNSFTQRSLIPECLQIVHLTFYNTPEVLGWAVVNTAPNSRHRLAHILLFEHALKHFTGVLEASVAMKDWLCIRITLGSLCICIEY